jgi:uncharacterized protein
MIINILGAESLGVRGLSCLVELKNRKIFIDPGIALGWSRYGFLPHPFQIAIGAGIKKQIIEGLKNTDDVIFSHFDGDHCPLNNANPYQLGTQDVKSSLAACQIWAKGLNNSSPIQQKRRTELAEAIKKDLRNAEGIKEGHLEFSYPVLHGVKRGKDSMVMMSKIEENGQSFVHASDIQLLDKKAIEKILDWKPNIVLTSGPPLYHFLSSSFQAQRENAWRNAMMLSENIDTLIIDHHLLRSEEGIRWLENIKNVSVNQVYCAADFMKKESLFLEAWRKELYEWLPVSKNWHEDYRQGKVDIDNYRIKGWKALIANGKIKPCKWYHVCPIKEYTDTGRLERFWIENNANINQKRMAG